MLWVQWYQRCIRQQLLVGLGRLCSLCYAPMLPTVVLMIFATLAPKRKAQNVKQKWKISACLASCGLKLANKSGLSLSSSMNVRHFRDRDRASCSSFSTCRLATQRSGPAYSRTSAQSWSRTTCTSHRSAMMAIMAGSRPTDPKRRLVTRTHSVRISRWVGWYWVCTCGVYNYSYKWGVATNGVNYGQPGGCYSN